MKRFISILAALIVTTTLMAQEERFFVSGNFNFNWNNHSTKTTDLLGSKTEDTPASYDYDLGFQGHYMISERLAVGLGFNYSGSKTFLFNSFSNDLYGYTSLIDISPSVIYSVNINKQLRENNNRDHLFQYTPELALGIGIGNLSTEYWHPVNESIQENKDDISYFGVSLMPLNFNYFINNNVALSLGFGQISWITIKNTDNFSTPNVEREINANQFALTLNNTIRIGLRLYF